MLQVDEVDVSDWSATAASTMLRDRASARRTLTFVNPRIEDLAFRGGLDLTRTIVTVPAGALGVSLSTASEGVVIRSLMPASPLVGRVEAGWRLVCVDGRDVSHLGHDGAAAILKESSSKTRTLTLEPPQETLASIWFAPHMLYAYIGLALAVLFGLLYAHKPELAAELKIAPWVFGKGLAKDPVLSRRKQDETR